MERDEAIRIATGSGYGVDRMTILEAAATLVDADPTPLSHRLLTLVQGVQEALTAATARAEKAEAERDAYAKAKAENDDRFQIEAWKWRKRYELANKEATCAREVLAAWKAQRKYENKHNLVAGGCVSGELEQWCTHYVHAKAAHDAARREAGL